MYTLAFQLALAATIGITLIIGAKVLQHENCSCPCFYPIAYRRFTSDEHNPTISMPTSLFCTVLHLLVPYALKLCPLGEYLFYHFSSAPPRLTPHSRFKRGHFQLHFIPWVCNKPPTGTHSIYITFSAVLFTVGVLTRSILVLHTTTQEQFDSEGNKTATCMYFQSFHLIFAPVILYAYMITVRQELRWLYLI